MSETFHDQIHTAWIFCHSCPKEVAQSRLICGESFLLWGQSVSHQIWGANILSSHAKQLPYSVKKAIWFVTLTTFAYHGRLIRRPRTSVMLTTPYLPTNTSVLVGDVPHPRSTDLPRVVSAPAHRPAPSSLPLLSGHWEQRQSKVTLLLQLNLQNIICR